jgi:hypothetical protein
LCRMSLVGRRVIADPGRLLVADITRHGGSGPGRRHSTHALTQYIAAMDRSLAATTDFGVPK